MQVTDDLIGRDGGDEAQIAGAGLGVHPGDPASHVGIGGAHVRGVNSHGGISLGTRPREIGRDEIKQAVERARAIPLPADREVLAFAAAGGGLFALAGLDFYVFANATKPERTST